MTLLPCPFCGNSLIPDAYTTPGVVKVYRHPENNGCFLNGVLRGVRDLPEDIADWNRRTFNAVRPLEWHVMHAMEQRAITVVGVYTVRSNHTERDNCWKAYAPEALYPFSYDDRTEAQAKTEAQNDYERRIRSALE